MPSDISESSSSVVAGPSGTRRSVPSSTTSSSRFESSPSTKSRVLYCSRGSETSFVVEEKPMQYAVDEQRVGSGSENVNMINLRSAKHATEFVFAEPFLKRKNAKSS